MRMTRTKRPTRIPGTGYLRQPVALLDLEMIGPWLIVREELEDQPSLSGLLIARQGTQHSMIGTVLRASSECELEGIREGDRVCYQEWAGGRWALMDELGNDINVLIMDLERIIAKVE